MEDYTSCQIATMTNTLQVDNLPPFYVDVVKQWQMTKDSIRSETPPTPHRTYEEVIWNNNIK